MRVVVVSATLAVVFILVSSVGKTQDQNADKAKQLSSNQALMRDKLMQMNRVLEGLTLGNFSEVQESAKTLGMISRATSWHVTDPTPRYKTLSKNFQEVAVDLERHAKDQNLDAATLDLVRLNVTCTQCHQHMRENAARRK